MYCECLVYVLSSCLTSEPLWWRRSCNCTDLLSRLARCFLVKKNTISFLMVELSWAGSGRRKQNSLGGWGYLLIPAVQKRRTRVPLVVGADDKKKAERSWWLTFSIHKPARNFITIVLDYLVFLFLFHWQRKIRDVYNQWRDSFIPYLLIFGTLKGVNWKWVNFAALCG